jgi:hypothetical protein
MYKFPSKRERLEGRETKSLDERQVIALEHLCDKFDEKNLKQLEDKW